MLLVILTVLLRQKATISLKSRTNVPRIMAKKTIRKPPSDDESDEEIAEALNDDNDTDMLTNDGDTQSISAGLYSCYALLSFVLFSR